MNANLKQSVESQFHSKATAMRWFYLVIVVCPTVHASSKDMGEISWFDFGNNDIPEHECWEGAGAYASLFYPNRRYICMLVEGRPFYMSEMSCPQGECYNASRVPNPAVPDCHKEHCKGKVFRRDDERGCHIRRSKGPFTHPTDPTRGFMCRSLNNAEGGWDFDYEERCGYSLVSGSIFYNMTDFPTPPCRSPGPPYFQNLSCYYNTSITLAPKPRFPSISADYGTWDDVWISKDVILKEGGKGAIDVSLWPSQMIPYYIDKSLDSLRPNLYTAMMDFQTKTCIRFIPWSPGHAEYLYIFRGESCYSFVGLQNSKGQQLSLHPTCRPSVGVILHHLIHTLGFFHEHNRSDRDEYLDIRWDNVAPGHASDWDQVGNILVDNFTTDTVMIYPSLHASKDGENLTMLDKSGKELPNMELSTSMSAVDAKRINALYDCPKR